MKLLPVSVVLVASCMAGGQDAATTDTAKSAPSAIHTISISKPNLEVTGSRLGSVEIWIEPTGTGVGERLVGEAKRTTTVGRHEKWIFPIASLPGYPHSIMAVNASAKGYNREGKEVGRKSLGFKGVSECNSALYGRLPSD